MYPDREATERLRAALTAQCGDAYDVDAKRTQYAFDEDWEAFSDIAVRGRGPGDDFRIVVMTRASDDARHVDFILGAWRLAQEVWFVDDAGVLRASLAGLRERLGPGDVLRTPALPGVEIAVSPLFAPAPSP